jgi:hypothetical protein
MKRYITHPNPPRKWNRCAWRWPGHTPYSANNDGTLQVSDAESRRFIEAADGGAMLLDMESAHERCVELTRDAVLSLNVMLPRGRRPLVFINGLNPETEDEMRAVHGIFMLAGNGVVTIGGYIDDSPERTNDGELLWPNGGGSFSRDIDRTIRRAELWREITSLPLCVQIMDRYNYPDVSQDGQWIGTAKPLSDADIVNQAKAYIGSGLFAYSLYWTPEGIDQRVIRAWGTR